MQRYCFFLTLQTFSLFFSPNELYFPFTAKKTQKQHRFHTLFFMNTAKPSIFVLCFNQNIFIQLTIKQE